jgi:hypothetical protein
MKGMVFTEFLEMVEDRWSPDVVDTLLDEVPLASGGMYTSVGIYGHEELVALVQGLSERVGTPMPDLVRGFGAHLFGRFVAGHPKLFVGIDNAFDFLACIETMIHVEVLKLYPDASLPRFDIERDGDRLTLIYRSSRHFEDLAHGLVEGCLAHYGETADIVRGPVVDAHGPGVRFIVNRHA